MCVPCWAGSLQLAPTDANSNLCHEVGMHLLQFWFLVFPDRYRAQTLFPGNMGLMRVAHTLDVYIHCGRT